MNCPHYANAQQRSFYSLDPALNELVERAEQEAKREMIPVGEATEVDYSEYLAAVKESQ